VTANPTHRRRKRATPLPRLFLTPGEPAGVGPDLAIVAAGRRLPAEVVLVADPALLERRLRRLGRRLQLQDFDPSRPPAPHRPGRVRILSVRLPVPVKPGQPDPAAAAYVLDTLRAAVNACRNAPHQALVTGPVNKATINQAGIAFSGHTEFLAELTGSAQPVMLLAGGGLRVALLTTHLPLSEVPRAVTAERLMAVLTVLERELRTRFGLRRPHILVAGLNPHAGEQGHLGREEIEVISPALDRLRARGLRLTGPLPADTLFTPDVLAQGDAVLAMYHDQGLPALKNRAFGRAVNVTLGLPIVRTSVDHGTALELAGSGRADPGSLLAAIGLAAELAAHA
jgi:4-hydroxythreonine-4-phosphate dehydrogenase